VAKNSKGGNRRAQTLNIGCSGFEAGRRRSSAWPRISSGLHPAAMSMGDAGRHRREAVTTQKAGVQ
jgi:hypothetical protein